MYLINCLGCNSMILMFKNVSCMAMPSIMANLFKSDHDCKRDRLVIKNIVILYNAILCLKGF